MSDRYYENSLNYKLVEPNSLNYKLVQRMNLSNYELVKPKPNLTLPYQT